jgi:branched-chain amino acid transport system ATP-binding protein
MQHTTQNNNDVLHCDGIVMRFGGLVAVSDFQLKLSKGELAGLIGPNGAGKTTVFNMITGVYTPTEKEIYFYGEKISGLKPHLITAKGIARTFQNIRLFGSLPVLDNIMLAHHLRVKSDPLSAVFRLPWYIKEEKYIYADSMQLLHAVGLEARSKERADSLPYGEQRRLEIARALATKPKLLLLDEPAAGMNPQETEDLMRFIQKILKDFDLTILLIEHDMKVVMGICERILVLDYGITIAEGVAEEIQNNPKVIEAYLGAGADAFN